MAQRALQAFPFIRFLFFTELLVPSDTLLLKQLLSGTLEQTILSACKLRN